MDFSKIKKEEVERIIKLLQDIYDGKEEPLTEHNKIFILKELRNAKLEHILNT